MAPSRDIEAEGVTTFHPPSTSYRYVLQLKDDKLSIWMEDRTSKKQWYKGDMAKAAYVTSVNSITDASPLDYLKCFQDALDCELDNCGDVQRTLEIKQGGVLRLSFAVRFRLLRSTRVAKYSFDLDPVSVERIDVLESKLRDQQEEVERLRKDISAGRSLPFARFEASNKDASTREMLWNAVEAELFPVTDGSVLIRRPGVYSVTAVVNNFPSGYNDYVDLVKNKVCVQKAACFYMNNHCYSATLSSVMQFDEGDTVSVICDGTVKGTCYLVIAQIGR